MTDCKNVFTRLLFALAISLTTFQGCDSARATDGDVDMGFNPGLLRTDVPQRSVRTVAMQADGKIILGGNFTNVSGIPRNQIARANVDGSLDTTFDPGAGPGGSVIASAVQGDGKIVIGVGGSALGSRKSNFIARLSADGSVDKTFNPGPQPDDTPNTIVIQPDGKILIGTSNSNANSGAHILRLNTDGSTDSTFNPGAGADRDVITIALQADGKIVIGGTFSNVNGVPRSGIARLNPNGSVDTTFVPAAVTRDSSVFIGGSSDGTVSSAILQPNGQFLIGGDFDKVAGANRNGFARLNADGSLDPAFNPSVGGMRSSVAVLLLQSDGRILAAGNFSPDFSGSVPRTPARFNPDGSPDPTFDPGSGTSPEAMVLQSDRRVIVGGSFDVVGGIRQAKIGRLNANGSRDNTFGLEVGDDGFVGQIIVQPDRAILIRGVFSQLNGFVRHDLARLTADGALDDNFNVREGADGRIRAMALQRDGKVVVGGDFSNFNGVRRQRLARLNADGAVDSTFEPKADVDVIGAVAVQPDSKILVVGSSFPDINGTPHAYIARLNSDGSLDAGFNNGPGADDFISNVILQPDGKVVFAGTTTDFNRNVRTRVVRLNSDGSVDGTFDSGTGANAGVSAFLIQPDGRIIVVGFFSSFNGAQRSNVARLSGDGSVDSSFVPSVPAGFNPNFSSSTSVDAIALQGDGKLLLGGIFKSLSGPSHENIVRLNIDGTLDSTFNAVVEALSQQEFSVVTALGLQSDGRIVVGGDFALVDMQRRTSLSRVSSGQTIPGERLLNIATRLNVLGGDNVLIGGFIITGNAPKNVLLRAIGPSLTSFGVMGALADPTLELHQGATTLAKNDNWKINDASGQSQEADIRATTIPPSNDMESAILTTLAPGAYSAVVSGKGGGTGIGVVEAYDLDQTVPSQLANIASRGFIDAGNNVMIGGFILGPNTAGNAKVVIRGIGPSLTAAGVPGALQDPTLELHDGNGAKIAFNDNWQDDPGAAEVRADQLDPKDPRESALLRVLPPGAYSAIVAGSGNTTGIGLVEIYNLQ